MGDTQVLVQTPLLHAVLLPHTLPTVPQLLLSLRTSTSQPLEVTPSTLKKLGRHEEMAQAPLTHEDTARGRLHTLPHTPQLEEFVLVFTSQPLLYWRSQSAKGATHDPMTHVESEQAGLLLGATHFLPQDPQLLTLVAVLISHPLEYCESQSAVLDAHD